MYASPLAVRSDHFDSGRVHSVTHRLIRSLLVSSTGLSKFMVQKGNILKPVLLRAEAWLAGNENRVLVKACKDVSLHVGNQYL